MAASYEARTFGVRSAMPSATAQRLCADLVFVKPRFDVYKEVSRQIRAIFLEYTPLVEPLSLDEAYLDVTTNLKNMPLASEIAREIRARILEETGLTASAGISYNKFLAKLASDHRKPNGQFVITPEKGPAFVEEPAGRQVPRRRSGDRGQDEAARHPYRRRPQGADAGVPAAIFRQGRRLLLRHRPRPGRPPGGARPAAQVGRLGDDLSSRISASRPRSRTASGRCWRMSGAIASAPASAGAR